MDDPVAALREISRDPDLEVAVECEGGRKLSGLDILETYLDRIEMDGARGEEDVWVTQQWRQLLDLLRRDPDATADRLDWTAKRALYREIGASGATLDKAELTRVDLAYHLVDPDLSVYDSLVEHGRMRRLVDSEAVNRAMFDPPTGTRAAVRGALLKRFGNYIEAMEWDSVMLSVAGQQLRLTLDEVCGEEVRRLESAVKTAKSVEELLRMLGGSTNG